MNMATRRQNAVELTFYTAYFILQALTFPGILLFEFSKICNAMPWHGMVCHGSALGCIALQRNECANASEQMDLKFKF